MFCLAIFIEFIQYSSPTNLLQPAHSWTSQPRSIQVFSASFISSSTVLLHVSIHLPLPPFPRGVHFRAACGRLLMSKPSPPSLLHLIDDVIDVGAFRYFFCLSLVASNIFLGFVRDVASHINEFSQHRHL